MVSISGAGPMVFFLEGPAVVHHGWLHFPLAVKPPPGFLCMDGPNNHFYRVLSRFSIKIQAPIRSPSSFNDCCHLLFLIS